MKAVPKKKLWRCRYHCSDYRGVLIFVALAIPVIALLMGWIDGTGLKNLPLQVTIGGVLFILLIVVFILTALRKAEYNYFMGKIEEAADLLKSGDKEASDAIIRDLKKKYKGTFTQDDILKAVKKRSGLLK